MLKPAARERTLECDIMGIETVLLLRTLNAEGREEPTEPLKIENLSIYSQDKH